MLGRVWCILHLNLGKNRCFRLVFHTILTSRASWYAPPDTGVSNLILVAVEYLLSTEGAGRIFQFAPFCREVVFIRSALCRGGALLRPLVLISSEARAEQSPAPTGCTQKASPMMGRLGVLKKPKISPQKGADRTCRSAPFAGRFYFLASRYVLCRVNREKASSAAKRA